MDFIDADNIKLIEVAKFNKRNNDGFTSKYISDEIIRKKALFIDDTIIDIETEDIIETIDFNDGFIFTDLKYNTYYLLKVIDFPTITQDDMINANLVYKNYKEKQELIKNKKLILFPGKYIK